MKHGIILCLNLEEEGNEYLLNRSLILHSAEAQNGEHFQQHNSEELSFNLKLVLTIMKMPEKSQIVTFKKVNIVFLAFHI